MEEQKSTESHVYRRIPKCTKCRNHKIISTKKGHKGLCRFEDCVCLKCEVINEKRAVMRAHIRVRRALDKQEKKSAQLVSDGPSIQVTHQPIQATDQAIKERVLPPIHWSFGYSFYNFGVHSKNSELSQQNWGSINVVNNTGADYEHNYSLVESNDKNN